MDYFNIRFPSQATTNHDISLAQKPTHTRTTLIQLGGKQVTTDLGRRACGYIKSAHDPSHCMSAPTRAHLMNPRTSACLNQTRRNTGDHTPAVAGVQQHRTSCLHDPIKQNCMTLWVNPWRTYMSTPGELVTIPAAAGCTNKSCSAALVACPLILIHYSKSCMSPLHEPLYKPVLQIPIRAHCVNPHTSLSHKSLDKPTVQTLVSACHANPRIN
ncbi:hypothetical protein BS47DRAFT_1368398 [Hydnum rufescens UP504]|uniref:Uncharacterized protein n=1 Tax=Hydnum rufescens UP504 TaxID=1448309 RepID=A0A9P6DNB0_9AGAM|nr:hypothetical protein BS47DRAFT_1368398 [Hydnum rufescens UP504]